MGSALQKCRKCGKPLIFKRREFNGELKWYPANPDGSDHWETCLDKKWTGLSEAAIRAKCDRVIRPFWTVPNDRGSYRVVRQMPSGFGEQPDGELF